MDALVHISLTTTDTFALIRIAQFINWKRLGLTNMNTQDAMNPEAARPPKGSKPKAVE